MEYSKEELLNILIKYNEGIGFPTQRKFNSKNGLPSYATYVKRFGSFKNAILESGIKIPKEKERYFNRTVQTDELLLDLLRLKTIEKLKLIEFPIADIHISLLLTNDEIDSDKEMTSSSVYYSRFGGISEAYKKCNLDVTKINRAIRKKDMKLKFSEITKVLGRSPNSRDLNRFSNNSNYYYCTMSHLDVFGSLSNLYMNMKVVKYRNVDLPLVEAMEKLNKLYVEYGILPTRTLLETRNDLPSMSYFRNRFKENTMEKIYKELNIPASKMGQKIYYTVNGTKCLSYYEYVIASQLENNKICYEKEIPYKNVIPNFEKKYRFDFKIKDCFVEVFGITGNEEYSKKVEEKIKICKENNINLISLFPNDILQIIKNEYTIEEKLAEEMEQFEV